MFFTVAKKMYKKERKTVSVAAQNTHTNIIAFIRDDAKIKPLGLKKAFQP